jgi:vacuolar-type H+-ATPase subunit I/STV1
VHGLGLMDDEFQKYLAEERAKRRDQDRDDFNNENAGRDVGRIARFLPKEARAGLRAEKREKKMSEALTRLAILMQDPAYAEAFERAGNTIRDFKERAEDRLQQFDDRIDKIDAELEALGQDSAGSEAYDRLRQEREDLQRRQQEILDYYQTVIQPMEERMNDPTDPPSKEEIDDFNDKVHQDMDNRFFSPQAEQASIAPKPLDVPLPSLG